MMAIVATGRRFFRLIRAAHASKPLLLFAALAAALLWRVPGAQAEYPDRPLKIIVPFAAGGSTDVMARGSPTCCRRNGAASPYSSKSRPGGGTAIGGIALANAAPDGYTIMIGPDTTFAINRCSHRARNTIRSRTSRRSPGWSPFRWPSWSTPSCRSKR